jgi:hypothetical protein
MLQNNVNLSKLTQVAQGTYVEPVSYRSMWENLKF